MSASRLILAWCMGLLTSPAVGDRTRQRTAIVILERQKNGSGGGGGGAVVLRIPRHLLLSYAARLPASEFGDALSLCGGGSDDTVELFTRNRVT